MRAGRPLDYFGFKDNVLGLEILNKGREIVDLKDEAIPTPWSINAALEGLGVAIVPEHLVEREINSGQLRSLPASGKEMVNQMALARRLDSSSSAAEKAFVEFLKRRFIPI